MGSVWWQERFSVAILGSPHTSSKRQRVSCEQPMAHSLALRACIESHHVIVAEGAKAVGVQCWSGYKDFRHPELLPKRSVRSAIKQLPWNVPADSITGPFARCPLPTTTAIRDAGSIQRRAEQPSETGSSPDPRVSAIVRRRPPADFDRAAARAGC